MMSEYTLPSRNQNCRRIQCPGEVGKATNEVSARQCYCSNGCCCYGDEGEEGEEKEEVEVRLGENERTVAAIKG